MLRQNGILLLLLLHKNRPVPCIPTPTLYNERWLIFFCFVSVEHLDGMRKKTKNMLREGKRSVMRERIGSKVAGQKWLAIINTHSCFAVMSRDQRAVRERIIKLLSGVKY